METHTPLRIKRHQESLSLIGKHRAARKKKSILHTDAMEDVSPYVSHFGHFFEKIFSVQRSRMFLNYLSRETEK